MPKVVMLPKERVEFDLDNFLKAVEKSGIHRCVCEVCNHELAVEQVIDDDNELNYIIFACDNCQKRQPFIHMSTDVIILADVDDDEFAEYE